MKNGCSAKDEFITDESWEDLCWLVYKIKGVAQNYPSSDKSKGMMQRRGGSEICELEFSAFCQSNSNRLEYDIRDIEARRLSYFTPHLYPCVQTHNIPSGRV